MQGLSDAVNSQTPVIEAVDLKKYYSATDGSFFQKKRRYLRAVDGASLRVARGEIFGVVGESGCGKSTLGRCILRLIEPTGGKVLFQGQDITAMPGARLAGLRRNMQMVFQNPFSSFNPKLKIGTSLMEVCRYYKMDKAEAAKKIRRLLGYISLQEDVLARGPGELSGGQLQRLAVARALLLDPSLIVADEPVSALDVSVQAQILNLIVDLRRELEMTMLFISHEMTVVEHICDTVAVMYLGKIVETAPTQLLFADIRHPYTQALMSAIPKADPEYSAERIILEGDIPSPTEEIQGCRFASRCRYRESVCEQTEPVLRDVGNGHMVACHFCTADKPAALSRN